MGAGSTPRACILLAAGEGKRMKSSLPKVLHPLLGRPMGHYALQAALDAGCESAVIVVGHQAQEVQASYQEAFPKGVTFALQSEQLGTGHAAQMAVPALDENAGAVLIVYGDTPLLRSDSLRELCELRETTHAPMAILTTELDDPTGYGRIVRNDAGGLEKIVEHRDATAEERTLTEVNPGIYVVEATFLKQSLQRLSANNAQNEYYLTDIVEMATSHAKEMGAQIPTLGVHASDTLGVNDRRQLATASDLLKERLVHQMMEDGVSFAAPSSVHIDADVTIAPDVDVGPGVCLYGKTKIDSHVRLHAGVVMTNCQVESGAQIHPYSVCEDAYIGGQASVGPFARLRPQTHLEENVKIGNFVEVKKSRLQKGAKASHLSYLGDAELGEGVNIGAGVITCNYDGTNKHQTTIHENVFVGSNSTLVAPLTLEKGVYVAAGSTVTRNVKENALALGRARQDNKEGYALRFRTLQSKKKNS